MRRLRYLNAILTVLALLLALNLWTAWTATPGGEVLSVARPARAQPQGIPNAAQQRKEMVDLLKKINVQVADLAATLKSGEVRVRVEATPSE